MQKAEAYSKLYYQERVLPSIKNKLQGATKQERLRIIRKGIKACWEVDKEDPEIMKEVVKRIEEDRAAKESLQDKEESNYTPEEFLK